MAKLWLSVGGSSGLGWRDYLEIGRACDDLGFHGFYPSDHLGPIQAGRGPATDRLDAMMVLAALSQHTTRLRLGALVMGNQFRHPVITAKIVGALDHVSDGRAELGLGASTQKDEHVTHSIEFPPYKERQERLDEALGLIRALWTQERARFQGKHFHLDGVEYYPKPVQQPYPPIIVGGTNPGTLRIAAKHADEWNTVGIGVKAQAALIEEMKAACKEVGRDFSTLRLGHQLTIHLAKDPADARRVIERQVAMATNNRRFKLQPYYASPEEQVRDGMIAGGPEEIKEGLQRWLDLGVTHMNMHTPRPFDRQILETISSKVLPAFA